MEKKTYSIHARPAAYDDIGPFASMNCLHLVPVTVKLFPYINRIVRSFNIELTTVIP